jgi:hypothetical protein
MRPQGFGQVGNGLEDLGWNDMGFEPPKAAEVARDVDHDAFGDDLVEHPRVHPTGLTPVQSPVHDQQAEIVHRLSVGDEAEEPELDDSSELDEPQSVEEALGDELRPVEALDDEPEADEILELAAPPVVIPAPQRRRAPRPRSAPGSKGKAAFTLRLDPDRHLKLRLACAVDGRSAQQLVTDALDQLLERMPEVDGLAAKAKRRG